jgi:hypothetical protein
METYTVTFWLDNGSRRKRAKFDILIETGADISEAAISQMPGWIADGGWEIEDAQYNKKEY